ncbi:hypothetical protein NEY57_001281 [Listeria monocytogenes]|uniref:hypothetical protein n=1 Tax=Listeria monocytogenes TaxID=1639 RepID=UPI0010EDF3B4|nr:hypothetical protein [Listeria monocytogenes]EAD6488553.1 hypothetical protein [Listeria monocytogenes]EAE3595829.1 hypothetical protein [Listeria monocytogenes]EAE6008412.1 hypothetical protein [Listeria monocytogenes]EAE7072188.1 hypothetical protein [Listeria monocytogenes]EAF8305190.1 hypothetical protein [Listeria monocytogenes]
MNDFMYNLSDFEIEERINKLIHVEKTLPKQIFFEPNKYNYYFEEPEAISIDDEDFIKMIKQLVEKTHDKEAYISEILEEKKFLQKWKISLELRRKIDFSQSDSDIINDLDIDNIMEKNVLIHFFMYFPSEQIFILADGYSEIAVLAIDKKLDVDVSWYEVEEYCSVEIIKKRFSNVLIKNYRNFS